MAKFHTLEPFGFAQPAAWPAWKQRFSHYRIATKLNQEGGDVQINTLLYSMGRKQSQYSVLSRLQVTKRRSYAAVWWTFCNKKEHDTWTCMLSYTFPAKGECVESFDRRLHKLAEYFYFNFKRWTDPCVVIGISDNNISQKLQLEMVLTLEKAISIACQFELRKITKCRCQDDCKPEAKALPAI